MSKPVKNLIIKNYQERLGNLDGAVLIDVRSLKSNQTNNLRTRLAEKKITVRVVKNNLAKKALAGSKLEPITQLLEGSCAMVYGGESVVDIARQLIEIVKELETLTFKGALMDGQLFQPDQIAALSKYPTKTEAQGQLVTLIFSPARKLAAQIKSPAAKLAGIIKAIQEKKEKEPAPAPAAA